MRCNRGSVALAPAVLSVVACRAAFQGCPCRAHGRETKETISMVSVANCSSDPLSMGSDRTLPSNHSGGGWDNGEREALDACTAAVLYDATPTPTNRSHQLNRSRSETTRLVLVGDFSTRGGRPNAACYCCVQSPRLVTSRMRNGNGNGNANANVNVNASVKCLNWLRSSVIDPPGWFIQLARAPYASDSSRCYTAASDLVRGTQRRRRNAYGLAGCEPT